MRFDRVLVGRIVRFLVTAGIVTVTDVGVALTLIHAVGTSVVVAAAAGYATSVVVAWLVGRYWVFDDSRIGARSSVPRYLVVSAGNAFVAVSGAAALVHVGVPYIVARASLSIVLVTANFVLNRLWVFPAADAAPAGTRRDAATVNV